MKTIFDTYSAKELENLIEKISKLIYNRLSDKEIIENNKIEFIEEILSIAKARKRASESKSKSVSIQYFNEDDLRFSTPKDVADYRAKRLKCNRIVDLCSGVGSQSLAFLTTCKNVLAVEIDNRKITYGKMNDKSNKIQFICGDILSQEIIHAVKNFSPEIIFCDPERLVSEEERNLESIKPDIRKVIEIYSKITPNLCIEVPPQIDSSKLKELKEFGEFEAEYISFNNKLNRLNLYFGTLRKCEVSVADILGVRIEKSKNSKINEWIAQDPLKFIYESSTAIAKAGLEKDFAKIINAKILRSQEKGKLLLTSNQLDGSDYSKIFSNIYRVIGVSKNFDQSIQILKKLGFGKVLLKIKISPEKYWSEREKYQKMLKGKKEAVLFDLENQNFNYMLCEKIN